MLDPVRYLRQAGFDYKPASSPDLWTHLESQLAESHAVGGHFNRLSSGAADDLIARGEKALLKALADHHRRTGTLAVVDAVIDMDCAIGTENAVPLDDADHGRLLRLVEAPGTPRERLVHVLPVKDSAIPSTRQVTVTGGPYADGHTAGYYGLHPGSGKKFDGECAYLVTPGDIRALAGEMEAKAEEISVVTARECDEMLVMVKKLLG